MDAQAQAPVASVGRVGRSGWTCRAMARWGKQSKVLSSEATARRAYLILPPFHSLDDLDHCPPVVALRIPFHVSGLTASTRGQIVLWLSVELIKVCVGSERVQAGTAAVAMQARQSQYGAQELTGPATGRSNRCIGYMKRR